jgi:predicted negative regulator of RcsB-dependent stress response
VEIYQTEEQQVQAIKSYWSENGSAIIAGLVVGFSGFIGFNLYQDYKLEQEMLLSDSYQSIIESVDKNPEQFASKGQEFIASNGNTSYAALTALALAKEAAAKKDWASAEKHLQEAIKAAPSEGMKGVANLRLARVQIQLGQIDQALSSLAQPMPASFKASMEETKGDAYLQQGKKEQARTAYQAAFDADGLSTSPSLQMKLDDLAQTIILSK